MTRKVDKNTYVYWISTLHSVLYIWICCSRHHRQLSLDVECCIANCSLLFNVASFAECSYGNVSLVSATFSCYHCLFLCSRLILHGPDFKSTDIDTVEWYYMPGCQCSESFWYSPQSRASFEAFVTHVLYRSTKVLPSQCGPKTLAGEFSWFLYRALW